MDKKIFYLALSVFFLLAFSIALAQDEIAVVQFTLQYDENFGRLEIIGIKTLYGYASQDELPGNAEMSTVSASGETLNRARLALLPPHILYSYSITDTNQEGEEIEQPSVATSDVFIPYNKEIEKAVIKIDNLDANFEFSVKERLCNSDGTCDSEETAVSCPVDCPMDKEDGVCVWLEDNACDPDCARGVDPDCLKEITPEPEETAGGTAATLPATPAQTQPPDKQEDGGINYPLIGGAAGIIVLLLVFYFLKSGRDK
jgi:hypothetical protein